MLQSIGMNNEIDRCVRETHSLHVKLRKRMKRVFGKKLKESREVPGRIDFDYSERANPRIGAAEIFETPPETKGACRRPRPSVIDLKLFLQLSQQNPCCRSM